MPYIIFNDYRSARRARRYIGNSNFTPLKHHTFYLGLKIRSFFTLNRFAKNVSTVLKNYPFSCPIIFCMPNNINFSLSMHYIGFSHDFHRCGLSQNHLFYRKNNHCLSQNNLPEYNSAQAFLPSGSNGITRSLTVAGCGKVHEGYC